MEMELQLSSSSSCRIEIDNFAFVLALKMLCRGSADFAPQRS